MGCFYLQTLGQGFGQQHRQHADAQDDTDKVEGVVVGHDHRLLMGDFAELAQCRSFIAELVGEVRQAFRHLGIARYHRFTQVVEVGLGSGVQQGCQQGDANSST